MNKSKPILLHVAKINYRKKGCKVSRYTKAALGLRLRPYPAFASHDEDSIMNMLTGGSTADGGKAELSGGANSVPPLLPQQQPPMVGGLDP